MDGDIQKPKDAGARCVCGGVVPAFELNRTMMEWYATEIIGDKVKISGKWHCVKCGSEVKKE